MRQTVKTLADLKSIRFGIFDEIFCEQTEREYFFKTDGGLTPDDLEIVLPVQGGNLRLVAKTGYGGHVENEEDPVGLWDADANVPELENGVSGAKKFYRVAVAGTVDFGDGDVDFEQGDYAVQDEDLNWDKLDKDGGVVSFAGRGGAVVPQASDYSAFFQLGLKCALLRDIKANGTDGGNAAGSGRQRRTLNSKIDPHSLVALTDDVFVPVIGSYVILAQAPAQDVGKHRVYLYNEDTETDVEGCEGSNEYTAGGGWAQSKSDIRGFFTANGEDGFSIQHYLQNNISSIGLGNSVDSGDDEIYTTVLLVKVA